MLTVVHDAESANEDGRRLVVRNGYHHEREVLTAAGAGDGDRAAGQRSSGRSQYR